MKLIIAGSRLVSFEFSMAHMADIVAAARVPWGSNDGDIDPDDEIFIGDCPTGVDFAVRRWAQHCMKHRMFKAEWPEFGKAAGPMRNGQMVKEAANGMLLLIWDGRTPGSADILEQAQKANLRIVQHVIMEPNQLEML